MDVEKMAEIFEAVKVLPLRPSDFLVFRSRAELSAEQMALVHAYLQMETGQTRILILNGGADLEVLRLEEDPIYPAPAPVQELQASQKTGKAPGAIA